MSNITVNTIRSHVATAVQERIAQLAKHDIQIGSDLDEDDILILLQDVELEIDYSVDYYWEAWDIIGGCEFNNYDTDELDLTNCNSAKEAMMLEANMIVSQVVYECIHEELQAIAERFAEICEHSLELGFVGDMELSTGDSYGWNAHRYETEEGTCVHLQLEGEYNLTAVVGNIGGLYLSTCFTVGS